MTQTVLLALDTSTEFCSVALLSSSTVDAAGQTGAHPAAGSATSRPARFPARACFPAIRELFDEAGLSLADFDAIAFGAGPARSRACDTAPASPKGSRSA